MRIFHARIPTNCMNASQYTPCTRQMYYARFILSHKFTRYITNFLQLPQELTYNEYFVYYVAEADNCVDYAHMERGELPFLSSFVADCISDAKGICAGGAKYNFTGPQAFGVADSGD